MECGGRTDGVDAVEGIRARLPLFSRSGFAAGEVSEALITEVRSAMPELPAAKVSDLLRNTESQRMTRAF